MPYLIQASPARPRCGRMGVMSEAILLDLRQAIDAFIGGQIDIPELQGRLAAGASALDGTYSGLVEELHDVDSDLRTDSVHHASGRTSTGGHLPLGCDPRCRCFFVPATRQPITTPALPPGGWASTGWIPGASEASRTDTEKQPHVRYHLSLHLLRGEWSSRGWLSAERKCPAESPPAPTLGFEPVLG